MSEVPKVSVQKQRSQHGTFRFEVKRALRVPSASGGRSEPRERSGACSEWLVTAKCT